VDHEGPEEAMEDVELVKVAAFKLQDSANRLLALANAAQSARLRARFLSLARQLARYEGGLRQVAGALPPTAPGSEPLQTPHAALGERINKAAAR
jgi:hypothetical protein